MLKIGNIEYDFSRVNVQDALEIKNAMFILAKDNATTAQIKEANNIIDSIALKHLRVKQGQQWIDSVDENTIGQIFDNELAVIEISAQFMNRIKGFLEKIAELPTLKGSKASPIKSPYDSLVTGLVELKLYSWREVMELDIENAIHTFCIHYYKNFREIIEYKNAEAKAKNNHKF